jgi:hypothetical protein
MSTRIAEHAKRMLWRGRAWDITRQPKTGEIRWQTAGPQDRK